jgi:hypothetical protein
MVPFGEGVKQGQCKRKVKEIKDKGNLKLKGKNRLKNRCRRNNIGVSRERENIILVEYRYINTWNRNHFNCNRNIVELPHLPALKTQPNF